MAFRFCLKDASQVSSLLKGEKALICDERSSMIISALARYQRKPPLMTTPQPAAASTQAGA